MLNFEEYLKENKAPEKSGALIVVDVQDSFSKFISDEYVHALYNYCENFERVYQIWDHINQNEPTYTFPNEYDNCSKEYGDLELDHFDEFFHEADIERCQRIYENPSKGNVLHCKDDSVWLYVGEKHEWFLLKKNLEKFLRDIKQFDQTPTICGGSERECLSDLEIACAYVGLKPKLDFKYIYSSTFCPKGV